MGAKRGITALTVLLTTLGTAVVPAAATSDGGRNYFVDCSRSTAGDGSADRPWNSLDDVNGHGFGPGDQLRFRRGTRCAGVLAPTGSGAAGQPVRIGAYGNGSRPAVDGGGARAAVHLRNVQHWEIRDLAVTNTGASPRPDQRRAGVLVELTDFGTAEHFVIENVHVSGVNGCDCKDPDPSGGILFSAGGSVVPTAFRDVRIERNIVEHVDRTGIGTVSRWHRRVEHPNGPGTMWKPSTGVVIRGNTVRDTGGDGIVPQVADGALVEHNYVNGFNMRSAGYNAGIWAWNADNSLFQFNEVTGGHGTRDSMAFDIDGAQRNTVFQYNYSHDNEGGFLLICNGGDGMVNDGGVFRYNVSQNDRNRDWGLITIGCSKATNVQVYNNTIYTTQDTRLVVNYPGTPVRFTNNIFVRAGGTSAIADNASVYHNNLYQGVAAIPASDKAAVVGDPRFVAAGAATAIDDARGYYLADGSPAVDAASTVAAGGGRDFYGFPVKAGVPPHIGAYQGPAAHRADGLQ